jgi:hypothetical protein
MIKKYKQWKKELGSKLDIKKITIDLIKFTKREAKETRVAAKILSKIISNYFKITNHPVTKREIDFLKSHTSDLAKLIPVIASFPTPIPYLEIALILKKFGVNILPTDKDLDIPEETDNLRK